MNKELPQALIDDCYLWVKERFFKNTPKRAVAYAILTKQTTSPTQSKVGGLPYLPVGQSLPVNDNGEMYQLLAQINCADLNGLADFPNTGILQFFVIADYDGMDYQVIYHANIDTHYADTDVQALYQPTLNDCIELQEYAMTFDVDEMYPNFSEHFGRLVREYLEKTSHEMNVKQQYRLYRHIEYLYDKEFNLDDDVVKTICGGYHHYIHNDPKDDMENIDDVVVLFQLASEQDINLGDMGVINFLMYAHELKDREFDRAIGYFEYY
ncbi:MAG: YwqG family protein [Moraxella sp.]|nr:YwqG family protein [Moraxella sp.]